VKRGISDWTFELGSMAVLSWVQIWILKTTMDRTSSDEAFGRFMSSTATNLQTLKRSVVVEEDVCITGHFGSREWESF
jgi:hypothetical protein